MLLVNLLMFNHKCFSPVCIVRL